MSDETWTALSRDLDERQRMDSSSRLAAMAHSPWLSTHSA